ncbi:uncharacterized protein AFUA_2G17120 [Aspergillus fumigatus Af293]|uniref:Uncharacterized protein n=2 Tax=Aspergillus fumigatus TaxID=746128 RepID=B0XVK6_ASPFC|nr:hypothetical protein AFUB_032780 [Aspergillus fumigatus A1163]
MDLKIDNAKHANAKQDFKNDIFSCHFHHTPSLSEFVPISPPYPQANFGIEVSASSILGARRHTLYELTKSAIQSCSKLLCTRRGNSVASPPPHHSASASTAAYNSIPSAASSTPTAFPQSNHSSSRKARLGTKHSEEERHRKEEMPSTTSPPPSNTSAPSSPNTLTPETLESDLLTHLASTTALEDLHATLLSSLQRLGWTEKIRKLSLELLRAGRCERFDEVVEAVVASAAGIKPPAAAAQNGNGNGNGSNNSEDDWAELDEVDVRIPKAVVEQGVRAIKEVLREVIVIEDDPDLNALHPSEQVSESKGSLEAEGEKEKSKISKAGEPSVKNGDTSPTKKTEKPKTGKQIK